MDLNKFKRQGTKSEDMNMAQFAQQLYWVKDLPKSQPIVLSSEPSNVHNQKP